MRWLLVLVLFVAFVWASPVGADPIRAELGILEGPGRMTAAELRDLAARYWPSWEVSRAVRVAWCESRGDPHADTNRGYSRRWGHWQYIGLWQIDADTPGRPSLHTDLIRGRSLYDPETNAEVAAALWRVSGWAPWPWCGKVVPG